MKVRLVLDVDDQARYVIAHYFRAVDQRKTRTRASRAQVKRFAQAAVRSAVREQQYQLPTRAQAVAQRLGLPDVEGERLVEPREKQRSIPW